MKKVNGFTVYEETDKCALDEYSETLAQELGEKFEENKYDDSEVKQNIQDLQSEQKTQNTAIQNNTEELKLLKNNLPDPVTTEQSEEITVQDAMNYYSSLNVSGNSTQEQTETSPNTVNPSEIKNCGDNINRFDKSTIKTGYYLDSTGAEVANTNYAITDYIGVEENENYTYQGLNITASFGAKGAYYDSSKQFVSSFNLNAEDTTILIPENVKYVKFTIRTINNNQDTFKIEKGSIATPYSAYNCGSVDIKVENEDEEKIITFPLTEGQRLHLGDYLASDGIHHKKKKITFNGTEDWALNTVSSSTQVQTISFSYLITNAQKSDTVENIPLCSHLKGGITDQVYAVDKESIWINSNRIYIRINRDRLETENVAGLKAYLSEHNMTVEYPIVAEEVEAYTEEQQTVRNELQRLILYKGYNYITCTDETKCKMQLTYIPDINYKNVQRINCLGDSITQGLTNDNISFADYLELSVNKYGVSGTTIAKQEGETNSFLERYSGMGQADIVMVMGGTNDCNLDIPLGQSTSTNEYEFYGALKSLCSGLITKYADKLIFFATPIKRKTTQTNLEQYVQAIKDVCATYNIPILDLYNDLNMNPNIEAQYSIYYNDWLHPNNEGHKRIARKVQKYIDNEL